MNRMRAGRAGDSWGRRLVVAALIAAPLPTVACELDGLSHGYGPMSALFAGAHRYQSLNGLDEEDDASAPAPEAPAEASPIEGVPVAEAAGSVGSSAAVQPPPRRSFAAWAKTRPKPVEDSTVAPATWARPVSEPMPSPPSE